MDAKEKGAMGETVVYREIVSMLGELDFKYKVIQNARFPFESVYGERGYITAEIDIVVFTPCLLYTSDAADEL